MARNRPHPPDRTRERPLDISALHHTIVTSVIENGYAPGLQELMEIFQCLEVEVIQALRHLENDHGVVLHPNSNSIWAIHPFSLAPTNFLVRDGRMEWWSGCAWCALGAAALLARDVTITTTIGASGKQVEVHVTDGRVMEAGLYVHFPIPMQRAWDNVIYTCSTMLVFEHERQIDDWCTAHRIPKGDVQPLTKIWEFARVWYGKHLDPDWRKWTTEEARSMFDGFGLVHEVWQIPASTTRF